LFVRLTEGSGTLFPPARTSGYTVGRKSVLFLPPTDFFRREAEDIFLPCRSLCRQNNVIALKIN
jgi:hypothetical protein